MGRTAAAEIAADLRRRLAVQNSVRMVFAAAPSQSEMLHALIAESDVDWTRVDAFHMDEYVGLPENAPERFSSWLSRHLFDQLPFRTVHLIRPDPDPEACAEVYANLLSAAPVDSVCLGIGVNGHLAFNDPHVADLHDSQDVKIVALDRTCRQQQVDDQCFAHIDAVPTHAVTLTIPRLLAADRLFCVAPGAAKRDAVRRTIHAPISAECPATALRTHPRCTLYVDQESNPDG